MEVWYSLDGEVDFVEIASDANVAKLRDAIKAKNPSLRDVDPRMIKIYDSGTTSSGDPGDNVALRPGKKVKDVRETTDEDPLVVVAPDPLAVVAPDPLINATPSTEQKSKRFKSTPMDGESDKLLRELQMMQVNGKEVKMQPAADACKQLLDSSPLQIKIWKDDLEQLKSRLGEDSIGLYSFQKDAHVSFVSVDREADAHTALLDYIGLVDIGGKSWTGETEDEIHPFVDDAITRPVKKFFTSSSLRISRNNALKTSSGRADYSISLDYCQLFRGEDKMRPQVAKEDPAQELLDKGPNTKQWKTLYGPDVPYIFGYYCIGGTDNLLIQFVCITQDRKLVRLTERPFDLTRYSGMLGSRFFVIALVPHLLSIKANIRDGSFGLGWQVTREPEGVNRLIQSWTVQVFLDRDEGDCCLSKDYYYSLTRKDEMNQFLDSWAGALGTLPDSRYLMKLRRIKNKVNIPEDGIGRVRCLFTPLCQPNSVDGHFASDLDARLAVLHVCKALGTLHQNGLVHNDVRWPNVVRRQGANEYVLVDFDDMSVTEGDGFVSGIAWMDPDTHAPDINERHTANVDLWGLCKMMSTMSCSKGDVTDLRKTGEDVIQGYPKSISSDLLSAISTLCSPRS